MKTICSDKYGMKVTEELKPFIDKYNDKIRNLTKEFANDCIEKDIEYNSAYGIFLSMVMGELSSSYFQKSIDDLPRVCVDN